MTRLSLMPDNTGRSVDYTVAARSLSDIEQCQERGGS